MAGLINHLKVRAGVGRGHLSFPVVKTAEKWKQLLDDSLSIIATGYLHRVMLSMLFYHAAHAVRSCYIRGNIQ